MRYKAFFAVLIIFCAAGCNNKENPVSYENNKAPIIQAVVFNPDTVPLGESCIIKVIAVDPDSDKLTYQWETAGNISGSGKSVVFTPNSCCGEPDIKVTVRDNKGGLKDSVVIVPVKSTELYE
jgi:hypothetical protein